MERAGKLYMLKQIALTTNDVSCLMQIYQPSSHHLQQCLMYTQLRPVQGPNLINCREVATPSSNPESLIN